MQTKTQKTEAAESNNGGKKKPVHTLRAKNLRASVWANNHNGNQWLNVTFSRLYKDAAGNWASSESFSRDDLLLLSKLADKAFDWCMSHEAEQEAETDEAA